MFNNFGTYDAAAERKRLAALVLTLRPVTEPGMQEQRGRVSCKKQNTAQQAKRIQEVPSEKIPPKSFMKMDLSELELRVIANTPSAKIENNGGFYSTTCPQCGKDKILSTELNTLTAVCNSCYCAFILVEQPNTDSQSTNQKPNDSSLV